MGVKGTITTERLMALKDRDIVRIAGELGLLTNRSKEELANAIVAHQEGRCLGCEEAERKKKAVT